MEVIVSSSDKTADDIFTEAAMWSQRLSGHDDFNQEAFEAWLDADVRHGEALSHIEASSQFIADNRATPEVMDLRTEAIAAARRAGHDRWHIPSAPMNRRAMFGAIAATLVAAATGTTFWLYAREKIYRTGIGEQNTIALADGSRVFLDAASEVRVAFSEDARRLHLITGRAHFEVAKDPSRPFKVTADDKTVTAIGTAFTVEYLGQKVAVTLVEGRISVAQGKGVSARLLTADIKPAQQVILLPGGGAFRLRSNVDLEGALSWRQGILTFDDESLADVAQRMNAYSTTRIIATDPAVKDLHVSGTFLAGKTDAFIAALESYYPVKGHRTADGIVIRSS
jgi:transmembrane sensor